MPQTFFEAKKSGNPHESRLAEFISRPQQTRWVLSPTVLSSVQRRHDSRAESPSSRKIINKAGNVLGSLEHRRGCNLFLVKF